MLLVHEKSYDKSCAIKFYVKVLCCYNNKHDASMSAFCFYQHLSLSKHVDIFFDFVFSLEDKQGLSLGELICPFCIMFSTVIYSVFMHFNTLWSNSNAFSLIICKVHTKRENTGS